jgi:hypothetical protein
MVLSSTFDARRIREACIKEEWLLNSSFFTDNGYATPSVIEVFINTAIVAIMLRQI